MIAVLICADSVVTGSELGMFAIENTDRVNQFGKFVMWCYKQNQKHKLCSVSIQWQLTLNKRHTGCIQLGSLSTEERWP